MKKNGWFTNEPPVKGGQRQKVDWSLVLFDGSDFSPLPPQSKRTLWWISYEPIPSESARRYGKALEPPGALRWPVSLRRKEERWMQMNAHLSEQPGLLAARTYWDIYLFLVTVVCFTLNGDGVLNRMKNSGQWIDRKRSIVGGDDGIRYHPRKKCSGQN